MHLLELFSGTGSVGKVVKTVPGWTVTSIDSNPKFHPTMVVDVSHLITRRSSSRFHMGESSVCHLFSRRKRTAPSGTWYGKSVDGKASSEISCCTRRWKSSNTF